MSYGFLAHVASNAFEGFISIACIADDNWKSNLTEELFNVGMHSFYGRHKVWNFSNQCSTLCADHNMTIIQPFWTEYLVNRIEIESFFFKQLIEMLILDQTSHEIAFWYLHSLDMLVPHWSGHHAVNNIIWWSDSILRINWSFVQMMF